MHSVHSRALRTLLTCTTWTKQHTPTISFGRKWTLQYSSFKISPQYILKHPSKVLTEWSSFSSQKFSIEQHTSSDYARVHPNKQKYHDMERRRDKLSDEWELIFTSLQYRYLFTILHCSLIVGLLLGTPLLIHEYFEREGEDDVLIAFIMVPSQYEILILGTAFYIYHFMCMRFLRRFPVTIYRKKSSETFKAVMPSWVPFLNTTIDFTLQNICHSPPKLMKLLHKGTDGWPVEYYKLSPSSSKRVILPDEYFRTGSDRYAMLFSSGRQL